MFSILAQVDNTLLLSTIGLLSSIVAHFYFDQKNRHQKRIKALEGKVNKLAKDAEQCYIDRASLKEAFALATGKTYDEFRKEHPDEH